MIHPTAIIHESALIREGSDVWSNAVICRDAVVGANCCIGSNCYVGAMSLIGDGSRLQHGTFLPNGSILGRNVFIGPNVTATDDRYPRVGNAQYHAEPPVLEDECSIGAGAVILPGVRIGKGALVGAGCVVTEDVPDHAVVVGNPSKIIRVGEKQDESSRS